jgi:hypothetical protein
MSICIFKSLKQSNDKKIFEHLLLAFMCHVKLKR